MQSAKIQVTPHIHLSENEIAEEFTRASGPGGQNVNKVETAVQLRFDVGRSQSLSEDVRRRLIRLAGRRVTEGGVLIIKAQRFRTRERNRQDALQQLIALIQQAAVAPRSRRATKPTAASRQKRLESKRRHSETKTLRRQVPQGD